MFELNHLIVQKKSHCMITFRKEFCIKSIDGDDLLEPVIITSAILCIKSYAVEYKFVFCPRKKVSHELC